MRAVSLPSIVLALALLQGCPRQPTTDDAASADAGLDARADAFVAADVGNDAFVSGDTGVDAFIETTDAGLDAFVSPMDAGTDAFVALDAFAGIDVGVD